MSKDSFSLSTTHLVTLSLLRYVTTEFETQQNLPFKLSGRISETLFVIYKNILNFLFLLTFKAETMVRNISI